MDNNNNPGGDKQPKMPKFNMNWLYTVIILLLAILFFTDGGTSFPWGCHTRSRSHLYEV